MRAVPGVVHLKQKDLPVKFIFAHDVDERQTVFAIGRDAELSPFVGVEQSLGDGLVCKLAVEDVAWVLRRRGKVQEVVGADGERHEYSRMRVQRNWVVDPEFVNDLFSHQCLPVW